MIREPRTDADSQFWWEGLKRGELLLQRCSSCLRTRFPPMPRCPYCGGDSLEVVQASGRGTVYSWVVVRRALASEFAAEVPYTIVLVDLQEGPRALGRLQGGEPAPGLPVRAVLAPGSEQLTFEPDPEAAR